MLRKRTYPSLPSRRLSPGDGGSERQERRFGLGPKQNIPDRTRANRRRRIRQQFEKGSPSALASLRLKLHN